MFIRVGRIVGAQGLRGLVKVETMTDFLERFEPGARLRMNDTWTEIESAQWHKNRLLLKLSGIDDRTAAENAQWAYLEAREEDRPELEVDEFLTKDLVGLNVFDRGESIGKVDRVLLMPAHDLLQVGTTLIPMVKEFVHKIDLTSGRIDVALIEGMREP